MDLFQLEDPSTGASMQIHGNEKQGIPRKKELFVVGSGTIYQLKCEEVAVNSSERWRLQ